MLETTSKSTHNWRRYPSSKCHEIDENVRFRISRSAMAPSDEAEKTAIRMHNYSPSGAHQPQRYFGKFTSSMTFGAHKLVRSEPFFWLPEWIDDCCQRYIATWKKFISTFSALNHCDVIGFKSISSNLKY